MIVYDWENKDHIPEGVYEVCKGEVKMRLGITEKSLVSQRHLRLVHPTQGAVEHSEVGFPNFNDL